MKKSQLKEIIRGIINEELALESRASDDAKRQGLEYMSFGRWGKDGKVTHVSKDGKLTKIDPDRREEPTKSFADFKSSNRWATSRAIGSLSKDEKQTAGAVISDPRFAEMYRELVINYNLPRSWAANTGWASNMETDEEREQQRANFVQKISAYIEDRVDNPETAKKLTAMFTDPNLDLSGRALPKTQPLPATDRSKTRDAAAQKEFRQWLKTARIRYEGKIMSVISALLRGGAARETARIAVRDKKVSLGLVSGRN
jgi:hypothetical protein